MLATAVRGHSSMLTWYDLVLTFVQYLLRTYYVPETQLYDANPRPGHSMLSVSQKQTGEEAITRQVWEGTLT